MEHCAVDDLQSSYKVNESEEIPALMKNLFC